MEFKLVNCQVFFFCLNFKWMRTLPYTSVWLLNNLEQA